MPGRITFAVTAAPSLAVIVGHVDNLAELGWHVDVVVGEPVDRALFPRADVHVLPMSRGASPLADTRSLAKWTALLRRLRPDVLVAANPKASVLALTAARIVGVPHRVWWVWDLRHHSRTGRVRRRVQLAADRLATVTVAGSSSLADAVVAAGARRRPLVLGFGAVAGVDLDVFFPADAAPDAPFDAVIRRLDAAPPGSAATPGDSAATPGGSPATAAVPVALCAGRLGGDKGLGFLTEIWPQVQVAVPEARLVIAGESDPLDPPGAALEFLAARPGVTCVGYVDDLADLLRHATVLLEPTAHDWLPEVVLEASAVGVPTVGWDVAGQRDAVADHETGYLLPTGDIAGFIDATTTLLADPDLARRMGLAARDWVAGRFERSAVEDLFAELVEGLISDGTHGRHPEPTPGRSAAVAEVDLRTPSDPATPTRRTCR
ncbi:MAG: hypothetical protein QG597_4533 [Actinomycetota bacterium]|nr:hypothetical protein [Actinomycetota bacterium]